MDILTTIISAVVGLGIVWVIVYSAIVSALKEHAIWVAAGGPQKELEKRTPRAQE